MLDGLVDPERGLVDRRLFSDTAVYQRELEQIFARCWLLLCPEAVIPRPGDFFATSMGEDPVVVVRQPHGGIAVLLNSCRHRGMKVCRADSGNAESFTCPCHGWAYDLGGRLAGVPFTDDVRHGELDRDELGLVVAPQVETYKGLVFATWDPSAPALQDYLGDAALFVDSLVDRLPGGMDVVGGTMRWRLRGNWKLAAEQFASDNYHGPVSHASALEALRSALTPERAAVLQQIRGFDESSSFQFASRHGHGSGFFVTREGAPYEAFLGDDALYEYATSIVPAARQHAPQRGGVFTGHNNIFPNASFLTGFATLRVWHPRGPDEMEATVWTVVDAAAPPEVREAVRRMSLLTFGPAGLLEQDDGENWGEIQKVLRGAVQRRYPFNYQMGLGHDGDRGAEFPGTIGFGMNEMAARAFYRRYAELMEGSPWSELMR